MLIDFHTHIGETVGKHEEDLLRSMDEARIDKSVIFAGLSMKLTNQELVQTMSRHPDRFLGVCSVAFSEFKDDDIYWEIRKQYLKHESIIGMKFYTGYQYFHPFNDDIKKYLQLLSDLGKVAIFHCGDTYTVLNNAKLKYAQPIHIDEVAVDFPNLKIVIAHMGYPWHRDTAEILYKNPNVYTDVSGFVYGCFDNKQTKNFEKVLEEVNFIYDNNWDRVLFGTDWPISNQKSYYETLKHSYEVHYLDIFSKNTEKLIQGIIK